MIWIVIIVLLVLWLHPKGEEPKTKYHASFDNPGDFFSSYNKGFDVAGGKVMTITNSFENMIVYGPTGSGKGAICLFNSIRSLAKGKSSMVIYDPSNELQATIPKLLKCGYKVLVFDPQTMHSECFNPLLFCRTISDINKVSALLVHNSIGQAKGEKFWELSAIQMISVFIRLLVFHYPPEYRTCQNVRRLVEKFAASGDVVNKLFVHANDEDLLSAYRCLLVLGERTLQSIVQTVRTCLDIYTDECVCSITAINTIDFQDFRSGPVALFICPPIAAASYYKPISGLLIQHLFDETLRQIPRDGENNVFYLIDEAGSLQFPEFATTISNIRKYHGGILLAVQEEAALSSLYGSDQSKQIKANCCTQVHLKNQTLASCQALSQVLGKYTFIDVDGREQGSRELMTVDEIKSTEEAIVLMKGKKFRLKPTPYYERFSMNGWVQKGYRHTPAHEPVTPSIIQFD